MTTPTREQVRRGKLNVRQLTLEAQALLEHSTPDRVVAEMMLAAAHVAQDAGMAAEDFIRVFGSVLCAAMKRDLTVSIEFDGEDDDE